MYALGCRTGHRGPARQAAANPDLLAGWAAADPLAGVPGIDIAAGRARRAGDLAATASVAAGARQRRRAATARQHRPPDVGRRLVGARLQRLGKGSRPGTGRPSLRPGRTPGTPARRWYHR